MTYLIIIQNIRAEDVTQAVCPQPFTIYARTSTELDKAVTELSDWLPDQLVVRNVVPLGSGLPQ
jgi:hypothetical protein